MSSEVPSSTKIAEKTSKSFKIIPAGLNRWAETTMTSSKPRKKNRNRKAKEKKALRPKPWLQVPRVKISKMKTKPMTKKATMKLKKEPRDPKMKAET